MVWVKESPNYAVRYNKNFMKVNPAIMKILFSKLRNGTLDMNNETEKMFKLFMDNGGETGYSTVRDIEKHKNDIKRELRRAGRISIGKAWSLLGERLDEYNRAVENCSMNFNKKGSGAKFIGANGQTFGGNTAAFVSGLGRSFYVFWNAAVQGTTNFGRQLERHPGKALTGVGAMFMLGLLMAAIGSGDDGDDGDKNAYYNLPEYVRRSNIVFRLPGMDEQWISIPLPVEYRAMYGMGELAMSAVSGKEHYTGEELANQIAGQFSQLMPRLCSFFCQAFRRGDSKQVVDGYASLQGYSLEQGYARVDKVLQERQQVSYKPGCRHERCERRRPVHKGFHRHQPG